MEKEIIVEPGQDPENITIAPATKAGGFIFLSGRAAYGVERDITKQTVVTLRALEKILKHAGSSLDKVVKVNVYLGHREDAAGMNEGWKQVFPKNPPARTTVEAPLPDADLLLEIDLIAVE